VNRRFLDAGQRANSLKSLTVDVERLVNIRRSLNLDAVRLDNRVPDITASRAEIGPELN